MFLCVIFSVRFCFIHLVWGSNCFFLFCFLFFLPFLLNHVVDRVLVLGQGVKPEPLRWEN